MLICFIRHGRTSWNDAGRIQGHTDIPLSDEGRRQVAGWRLPAPFATAACMASPLERTRETAALLGFTTPRLDPRLREMGWGSYEGRTLEELRLTEGDAMDINERLGLDFRPPEGESPREVAARVQACLADLAESDGGKDEAMVIVCHKGILRASIVLACGWEMLGKPPVRILDDHALVHRLGPGGRLDYQATLDLRSGSLTS